MRVGFDARTIDWSGIGTYSRNLLLHYAEQDLDLVIFCQDHKRELVPAAGHFSFVSANVNPVSRSAASSFASVVLASGIDLLHVPSHLAPLPIRLPLVSTIHDVIPLIYPRSIRNPLQRVRYRRQVERTVGQAAVVITPSQISKSTLTAYAKVDPDKVRVIHNGVSRSFSPVTDEAVLTEVRHRYGLPTRYAFWIGQFRPEKNLEFLLGGWGRVCETLAEPLPLVLAGAQVEDFHKIRKEAGKQGLDHVVLFPGFIQEADLAATYSAASVFVFPSLYEGFGLPPLEAMACGTPCVVSNSSALPEVTGRAALLFNPTSVEQFLECMVSVMEDADLNGKLRREGLRQSAMFSWEKAAAETIGVYRAVLA